MDTAHRMDLGDGLVLRPPVHDDADQIVAACRDPDVIRFTRVPHPYSHDDAHAFVDVVAPEDGQAPHAFAVTVTDDAHPDGRLVGMCGLVVDERDGAAELGYWTAPRGRGRGLTTRAARAVSTYGFEVLGVERIHLMAAKDNPASNRVARAIGFQFEGVARSAARYRDHDGTRVGRGDMNMYGLLPGEVREA